MNPDQTALKGANQTAVLSFYALRADFVSFLFVFKLTFCKKQKSFRNTIRVSNCLNTDQDQRFVCPDLYPNCLQRF